MISARLYDTLDSEERKYWHSHVFEVKSGMLIMPRPTGMPEAAWELAENKEMEEVVTLYGKVYHLWQVDKGDKLPIGPPQLMTSFTADGQFDFEKEVGDRDKRFGSDYKRKKAVREYIKPPEIHPGLFRVDIPRKSANENYTDADMAWKESGSSTSKQGRTSLQPHGGIEEVQFSN